MQFLSIYTPASPMPGPPSAEHMAKMGAFMEESLKSGVLVMTGGPSNSATGGYKATLSNGKFTVVDSPFSDLFSKGHGFAILQADTKERLMAAVKDFLEIAGDGECQILQIMGAPPPA